METIINNTEFTNELGDDIECSIFKHTIDYSDIVNDSEVVTYDEFIMGDKAPLELSITDNIISGTLLPLHLQPSIYNGPKQTLKEDGSNYKFIGRPPLSTYTFKFKLTRRIVYDLYGESESSGSGDTDDETTGDTSGGTLIESGLEYIKDFDVTIVVNKDHDVDNLIFVTEYFKAGHVLKIGNDNFKEEDITRFLKLHPGPFGKC